MGPLHWRGPAFLLFYLVLAVVSIAALWIARKLLERGPVPKLPFVDPYLIACLRGGRDEAIRVALLSLVDRGLVTRTGDAVKARAGAQAQARRPLEKQMLARLHTQSTAYELPRDADLLAVCEPLCDELVELGLYAGSEQRVVRSVLGACAVALLWTISGTKLAIAWTAGRHNVGFVVFLTLAATAAVWLVLARRRTSVGDALLADLRTLFRGLQQRAAQIAPGGGSQELALLAGVFGVQALEGPTASLAETMFPKAMRDKRRSDWGSGSGCGSSCSSSSSSSCGGGGCGGGGCGGCGS